MPNHNLTSISETPCRLSEVLKMVVPNVCTIARKFVVDEVHVSDEEAGNPNHASLKCSPLYSLISVYPDATPQQVLGLEPVFREFDNSGHSVRQS